MIADLRVTVGLTRYQLLATLRNRRAVVFGVVMPIVLLVLFNSIFVSGNDSVQLSPGEEVGADAYFTGGMLAYSILLSAFSSLAISIVTMRETGQLKRYRGTPLPPWAFIVATIVRAAVMILGTGALLLVISHFAYDVPMDIAALGLIVLYVVGGTAALAALAIAATALTTNVDSASGLLPFAAFLLSFISSIFVPLDQLPNWLADVGRIFPVYHVADGLQAALGTSGGSFDAGNFATLVAWGLVGTVLAARSFKWEPRGRAA